VVEPLPYYPKVKGLSPTIAVCIGEERKAKKVDEYTKKVEYKVNSL
jgi:hypothetical protein